MDINIVKKIYFGLVRRYINFYLGDRWVVFYMYIYIGMN